MHVRAVAERLCRRRRLCISSFADASQVSIPINRILHVRLKFTHTALSKPPIKGILRALWQRCRPINGKMKTTCSAFTDQSGMCWKQRSTFQPYCRALINLFPPISRPKRPPSTRTSGDVSTGPTRTLAYHPPSPGDLPALVRAFDGTKFEFRAFTAALLLHYGTAAWILEIAPSRFATLSTSKQAEVTESQEDFLTAYGRIGSTAAHHHIAGLLTMIFKSYAHTAHLVRAEVVYGLGKRAATDILQSNFSIFFSSLMDRTTRLWRQTSISFLNRFQLRNSVSAISRPCVL